MWTSSELLLHNPATNRWSRLPAAPLAGRQQTAGVWTGSELIVVGGNNTDGKVFADAAAYNPVTRSWRRLPPLPEARTGATMTWNGREVLVVGGQGRASDQARPYADGVAYSPAGNAWRRLPAMDSGRTWHSAVCTGRQLLVWAAEHGRVIPGRLRRTGSPTTGPPTAGHHSPGRHCGAGPATLRCGPAARC